MRGSCLIRALLDSARCDYTCPAVKTRDVIVAQTRSASILSFSINFAAAGKFPYFLTQSSKAELNLWGKHRISGSYNLSRIVNSGPEPIPISLTLTMSGNAGRREYGPWRTPEQPSHTQKLHQSLMWRPLCLS